MTGSVVPMSTQIFQSCLESTTCDESSDCQRDLVEGNVWDESLCLVFTMSLRVFSVVWSPTISIKLVPISLKPIQIAEAKLQDHE